MFLEVPGEKSKSLFVLFLQDVLAGRVALITGGGSGIGYEADSKGSAVGACSKPL